jgi:hypothetical protein
MDARSHSCSASSASSSRSARGALTVDDELFAALDGQEVRADEDRSRVWVYAVRTIAGRRWIQAGFEMAHDVPVTLSLALDAQADEALAVVRHWTIDRPLRTSRILTVR